MLWIHGLWLYAANDTVEIYLTWLSNTALSYYDFITLIVAKKYLQNFETLHKNILVNES